jgi:succinate dehydrogenase / fumarate reductase flavoprotein subunit
MLHLSGHQDQPVQLKDEGEHMHDVLVVGGGVAGLRATVAAKNAGSSVALITQSHPTRSFSVAVQDGLNSAGGSDDSWEEHAEDTLAAGAGISDAATVQAICRDAVGIVTELDRMGVPFNREGTTIHRVQLEGSRKARASYVDDSMGLALTQTLWEQAVGAQVEFFNEWVVVSLVVEDGICTGAVALEMATGKLQTFGAKAVVLATGGSRRAYARSTASLQCSGSGISIGYRAGAALTDMEFVQYNAAVLKDRRLALSPLLWARGATSTKSGVKLGDSLDASEAEARFPDTIHRVKALSGLSLLKDEIPVAPAMSRLLGGVAVGVDGATSVKGLFAAGECAGNGFHGASGIHGNFLLASVASGKAAGDSAAEFARTVSHGEPSGDVLQLTDAAIVAALGRPGGAPVAALRQELGELMDAKAGMNRNAAGLEGALKRIATMKGEHAKLGAGSSEKDYNFGLIQYLELGWLLDVAAAIAASALKRTESRGVHVRTDFPKTDEQQLERIQVKLTDAGLELTRQPVAAS